MNLVIVMLLLFVVLGLTRQRFGPWADRVVALLVLLYVYHAYHSG